MLNDGTTQPGENKEIVKTELKTSEGKRASNDRYLEKLEDIKIRVPKGYREIINEYAKNKGTNTNQLVITLVNEAMQRDGIGKQIPNGISSIPKQND